MSFPNPRNLFNQYPRAGKFIVGLMALEYFITIIGLVSLGGELYEYGNIHRFPNAINRFEDHVEAFARKRQLDIDGANANATMANMTTMNMSRSEPTTKPLPSWLVDSPIRGCIDTPDDETIDCDETRDRVLTIFLLSLLVGTLGVGRCVAGFWGCGVLKCLTCGGCGIWWLLDWIFILALVWTRSANGCCFQDNMHL